MLSSVSGSVIPFKYSQIKNVSFSSFFNLEGSTIDLKRVPEKAETPIYSTL